MLKLFQAIAIVSIALLAPGVVFAADLSLKNEGVYFSNNKPLAGEIVRIYATVENTSQNDVRASVRFIVDGKQVGDLQPISILAQKSSTVFVDWQPNEGYYGISVSVIDANPNDENSGNDTAEITDFIVDLDTDGDGIFNTIDLDDDNDGVEDGLERIKGTNPLNPDTDGDGVNDGEDEFPLDPNEKYDNDKDGIGNNADPDNDNDGVLNEDDPAPFDPNITGKEDPVVAQPPPPPPIAPEPEPASTPEPAPEPPPPAPEPEYEIEEVEYTFPSESEAEYNLEILIAKSRIGWNTYQFDALGAGGASILYLWDFGDGTLEQSMSPVHSFPGSGEYEIKLSISDGAGGLGIAEESVQIGFWNIGNILVQVLVGFLALFGLALAGYLLYNSFFQQLFEKKKS